MCFCFRLCSKPKVFLTSGAPTRARARMGRPVVSRTALVCTTQKAHTRQTTVPVAVLFPRHPPNPPPGVQRNSTMCQTRHCHRTRRHRHRRRTCQRRPCLGHACVRALRAACIGRLHQPALPSPPARVQTSSVCVCPLCCRLIWEVWHVEGMCAKKAHRPVQAQRSACARQAVEGRVAKHRGKHVCAGGMDGAVSHGWNASGRWQPAAFRRFGPVHARLAEGCGTSSSQLCGQEHVQSNPRLMSCRGLAPLPDGMVPIYTCGVATARPGSAPCTRSGQDCHKGPPSLGPIGANARCSTGT